MDDQSKPGTDIARRLDDLAADLACRLDRLETLLAAHASPTSDRLLTVAEKAAQLGRSPDYVRTHAEELGGIRQPTATTPGKRTRTLWRFPVTNPAVPRTPERAPVIQPLARRRPAVERRDLLPIRGRAA